MIDTSKIIHAPVGGGRYTVTAPITQWDYGYIFVPEFEDLPATYRLDFANDEHHGTALSVYCGAEGGEVPEELIDTGKDIFVWFFYVGDGFGKTEYKWRIPNKCKPKGGGETPEPSQQSSIDQLIYVANEAIDTAQESASDASVSAQSASESAEQAQESARTAGLYSDTAQTYANSAEISANNASASATASAQSASQSAQIKDDVESMVDDAQASASASAQSATASANSASQASASATSASQSASSAQGYASQAQTSAQTASTKASEASGYASTASQKATESAQSATNASQSAQTAEQAKTASQTAQGLAESARDTAVSAKTDAESARDDAETARDEAQQAVASISGALDDKAPVITDTASGSIASFSDGADNLPLKSLVVDINPIQDLSHGDPSPENLCPISGWTKVNVNHSDADMTNPTTLTIQLGQTVYGGKLDVLSGELVIDRAMVDLGTLTWTVSSGANSPSGKIFRTTANIARARERFTPNNVISDVYATADASTWFTANYIDLTVGVGNLGYILIRDDRYDNDVTAFNTAVSGVQLCYELATPIAIQLSPNQINSLYGVNNLWADSGDSEVEYRADTKLFIERLTAPDSADMIADANITSGKYFMVGNNLYKATANIASGASVIVGTNCIRKSLSEALNEINA